MRQDVNLPKTFQECSCSMKWASEKASTFASRTWHCWARWISPNTHDQVTMAKTATTCWSFCFGLFWEGGHKLWAHFVLLVLPQDQSWRSSFCSALFTLQTLVLLLTQWPATTPHQTNQPWDLWVRLFKFYLAVVSDVVEKQVYY